MLITDGIITSMIFYHLVTCPTMDRKTERTSVVDTKREVTIKDSLKYHLRVYIYCILFSKALWWIEMYEKDIQRRIGVFHI